MKHVVGYKGEAKAAPMQDNTHKAARMLMKLEGFKGMDVRTTNSLVACGVVHFGQLLEMNNYQIQCKPNLGPRSAQFVDDALDYYGLDRIKDLGFWLSVKAQLAEGLITKEIWDKAEAEYQIYNGLYEEIHAAVVTRRAEMKKARGKKRKQ